MRGGSMESGVSKWLRLLSLDTHLPAFLDNGYDDLETVKQMGADDLDAVGVTDQNQRALLLDAVRFLRERGAAFIYVESVVDNVWSQSRRRRFLLTKKCKDVDSNSNTNDNSSGVESAASSTIYNHELDSDDNELLFHNNNLNINNMSSSINNGSRVEHRLVVHATPSGQTYANVCGDVRVSNDHEYCTIAASNRLARDACLLPRTVVRTTRTEQTSRLNMRSNVDKEKNEGHDNLGLTDSPASIRREFNSRSNGFNWPPRWLSGRSSTESNNGTATTSFSSPRRQGAREHGRGRGLRCLLQLGHGHQGDDVPQRVHCDFSTRTRLRPKGATSSTTSSSSKVMYSSSDPRAVFGTPVLTANGGRHLFNGHFMSPLGNTSNDRLV